MNPPNPPAGMQRLPGVEVGCEDADCTDCYEPIVKHSSIKIDRRTNTEFITELMDFNPTGALCQIMIIQAIDQFTKAVAAAPAARFAHGGVVSGEAWKRCAEHIQAQLKERLA
jgi:hypothetical protein